MSSHHHHQHPQQQQHQHQHHPQHEHHHPPGGNGPPPQPPSSAPSGSQPQGSGGGSGSGSGAGAGAGAVGACAGCGRTGVALLVCDDCESTAPTPTNPPPSKQRYCANCMISKKVRVFWPLDEQWYVGVVQRFDASTGEHQLRYPDGDTEWVKIGDAQAAAAQHAQQQRDAAEGVGAAGGGGGGNERGGGGNERGAGGGNERGGDGGGGEGRPNGEMGRQGGDPGMGRPSWGGPPGRQGHGYGPGPGGLNGPGGGFYPHPNHPNNGSGGGNGSGSGPMMRNMSSGNMSSTGSMGGMNRSGGVERSNSNNSGGNGNGGGGGGGGGTDADRSSKEKSGPPDKGRDEGDNKPYPTGFVPAPNTRGYPSNPANNKTSGPRTSPDMEPKGERDRDRNRYPPNYMPYNPQYPGHSGQGGPPPYYHGYNSNYPGGGHGPGHGPPHLGGGVPPHLPPYHPLMMSGPPHGPPHPLHGNHMNMGPHGHGPPHHQPPHTQSMEGNSSGGDVGPSPMSTAMQGQGAGAKRKSGPKTWTKEEDGILLNMVQNMRMPMKWSVVAQSMPERTGKQCRERYVNHLNPRLKSAEWTPAEDATIFHLYNGIGSQWAKMSKMIPGRTDNGIKNRFHNLRRQLEREDEHRLRLSKPDDFPEEVRLDRIRQFPKCLKGRNDELWDMRRGIGVLAAQSVLGSGVNRTTGRFGPFREVTAEEGEQCPRCGLFAPSVHCGPEMCTKTGWCQSCTRTPPHISGNLLRECLNLRRSVNPDLDKVIEAWGIDEQSAGNLTEEQVKDEHQNSLVEESGNEELKDVEMIV